MTVVTAQDLRAQGIEVHRHVLESDYNWSNALPFDIQRHSVAMLTENNHAYLLSQQGTGKTRTTLWAYDYLRREGAVKRMLVVCPLSTMRFTWAREAFAVMPHYKVTVLHGSRSERLEMLAEDADIYVVNHDGIKVIGDELIKRTDIDVLVIDELAVFRNKCDRTMMAAKLAQSKHIVWGLTGAPTPNEPTDVFWQAKIVTPERVPRYYGRLREELMLRVNQFKWVPKADAWEKAVRVLQPNVRFALSDVVELPDFVSQRVDVPMGKKQAKVYREMATYMQTLIDGQALQAGNAGAMLTKLLQISLGWVYDQKRGVVELDNKDRLRAMLDAVDGCQRKIIVLAPFKHALAGISEALTLAGYDNTPVSGDTPSHARDKIFFEFQNEPIRLANYDIIPRSPAVLNKVLVAHPQCIAHGLTLTAADTILWFGPIMSSEIYDQATMRIRRIGQKFRQLFLHLQATQVERKYYSLLANKVSSQDALLAVLEDTSWKAMNEQEN
jgi:SNF2 family DNA or RNA helicase